MEWKATRGGHKIEDGIDAFVFRDGMICARDLEGNLWSIGTSKPEREIGHAGLRPEDIEDLPATLATGG